MKVPFGVKVAGLAGIVVALLAPGGRAEAAGGRSIRRGGRVYWYIQVPYNAEEPTWLCLKQTGNSVLVTQVVLCDPNGRDGEPYLVRVPYSGSTHGHTVVFTSGKIRYEGRFYGGSKSAPDRIGDDCIMMSMVCGAIAANMNWKRTSAPYLPYHTRKD